MLLDPAGLPGPRIVDAKCPDHVDSVPGRHFTCTVTFDHGGTSTMDFTVADDHGGYSTRINVLGGGMPVPEFGAPGQVSQMPPQPSIIKPPCFLRSACGQTHGVRINTLGGGLPSPEFGPPVG